MKEKIDLDNMTIKKRREYEMARSGKRYRVFDMSSSFFDCIL